MVRFEIGREHEISGDRALHAVRDFRIFRIEMLCHVIKRKIVLRSHAAVTCVIVVSTVTLSFDTYRPFENSTITRRACYASVRVEDSRVWIRLWRSSRAGHDDETTRQVASLDVP